MPKQTYIYRPGPDGKPLSILTERALVQFRGPEKDFDSQMVDNLYTLERREGSRFRIPGFNTRQLKQAWMTPEPNTA